MARRPLGTGPQPAGTSAVVKPSRAASASLRSIPMTRRKSPAKPDLADHDGRGGQRQVGIRRRHRHRHRQVRRRVHQPHPADGGQVDVGRTDLQAGPAFEHRGDHRGPRAVDSADRAPGLGMLGPVGEQCLDLADDRTFAVERDGDRGTRHRHRALVEEQPRGIRDALDPVVLQHETADLVGGAEPVLDAAHHAQGRVAVTLEVQHHVDEVFQRAGPAIAPSLVTCPTRTIATPVDFAVAVSAVVTARTWVTPPTTPSTSPAVIVCTESTTTRLGLHRLDVAQNRLHVGLGGQEDLVVRASGALGAHPDLTGRLLAGHVQRAAPGLGPPVHHLEQQRRLAHARIAGQQAHRAGHHTAA